MTQKSVQIPEKLYAGLQAILPDTVFNSVEELVLFALQDYVDSQPQMNNTKEPPATDEVVARRLKDLGYL